MRPQPSAPDGPLDRLEPAQVEIVRAIGRATGLPADLAARVLEVVLVATEETVEQYVRRRHRELQARGLTNERIFEQVAGELPARRFAASELSLRQLRRLVYG